MESANLIGVPDVLDDPALQYAVEFPARGFGVFPVFAIAVYVFQGCVYQVSMHSPVDAFTYTFVSLRIRAWVPGEARDREFQVRRWVFSRHLR